MVCVLQEASRLVLFGICLPVAEQVEDLDLDLGGGLLRGDPVGGPHLGVVPQLEEISLLIDGIGLDNQIQSNEN